MLSGQYTGQILDGMNIDYWDYPNQANVENIGPYDYQKRREMRDKNYPGIWIRDLDVKIEYDPRTPITIENDGVHYGTDFIDLCLPFDRYGEELTVGNIVMIAVSNSVKIATITRIKNITKYNGEYVRSITCRDKHEQKTHSITDSYATVKIS